MRVFLTGATGFIGSRIVPELIAAGHEVLGLTRSDHGAEALARAGAEVHRGSLEDPETLASGAAQADAVIHAAFDHDFANFLANCEKDRRVIEAMGDALAGSSKPFLITSGVGMGNGAPGQPATEQRVDRDNPNPRRLSELAGEAAARSPGTRSSNGAIHLEEAPVDPTQRLSYRHRLFIGRKTLPVA